MRAKGLTTHQGRYIIFLLCFIALSIGSLAQADTTTKKKAKKQAGFADTSKINIEASFVASFLPTFDEDPQLQIIKTVNYRDTTATEYRISNGFVGSNSGFAVKANLTFGESRKLFFPIGIDVSFFHAAQQILARRTSDNLLVHHQLNTSTTLTAFTFGANYKVVNLPLANSFIYAAAEGRLTHVPGTSIRERLIAHGNDSLLLDETSSPKESVLRLGGMLRIGVQGWIEERVKVSINGGFGIINLVGRDSRIDKTRRGELLTPGTMLETTEKFVYLSQFSVGLQYVL